MIRKIKQTIKNIQYLYGNRIIIRSILKVLSFKPPLCWLINRGPYTFLYNLKIKSQANPQLNQVTIIIEPTNFCNARCVMCPYPTMKRGKGIINDHLFKKIIDEIKKIKVKKINLTGTGEPLLDPKLIERIKYIKSEIVDCKIKFFTNASLLNKNKADLLIKSGIDEMIISFNGYKDSYKKVMGLNFDQTVNNIKYFLKIKPKNLHVHLSCMYVNENADDVKKINKLWGKYVDLIAVKMPENWGGGKKVQTPFSLPFPRKKWPCRALFDSFAINWDGKVVICCRDFNAQLVLGDINEQSIQEIWSGKKFHEIRQKHLEGKINEIPICSHCDTPILNAISWW